LRRDYHQHHHNFAFYPFPVRGYIPEALRIPVRLGLPEDLVEEIKILRTNNPNLKTVIPHHHRLQVPPGGTTPADVAAAVKAAELPVKVLIPELGKSYDLSQ
jgi:L-ascorbate metabolism protein UlaG (beta-lactamase superfamily)